MRVAIVSRFPHFDVPRWKRDICEGLCDRGAELMILYSRAGVGDHLFGAGRALLDSPARVRGGLAASRAPAEGARRSVPRRSDSLAGWARRRGIPVATHRRLGDQGCVADLRAFGPDVAVLLGADIVPAAVLEIPRVGTVNAHFGLLPCYRGMNVTEWSIYHDDPVGVSLHVVDPGIDTGDILATAEVEVRAGMGLDAIRAAQRQLASEMLRQAIEEFAHGRVGRVPQSSAEGRQYYRMHPLLLDQVERRLERGEYRQLARART
jgi:folate-dependent phosphoribosylglycinamide formyltransferase PurN